MSNKNTKSKKTKRPPGGVIKYDKVMKAVLQIRTTPEEKQMWFETAEKMGYKNVAECFRDLMKKAA